MRLPRSTPVSARPSACCSPITTSPRCWRPAHPRPAHPPPAPPATASPRPLTRRRLGHRHLAAFPRRDRHDRRPGAESAAIGRGGTATALESRYRARVEAAQRHRFRTMAAPGLPGQPDTGHDTTGYSRAGPRLPAAEPAGPRADTRDTCNGCGSRRGRPNCSRASWTRPTAAYRFAIARLESSAWRGSGQAQGLDLLRQADAYIDSQQRMVAIIPSSEVTLGGSRGTVPVSIENKLRRPSRYGSRPPCRPPAR